MKKKILFLLFLVALVGNAAAAESDILHYTLNGTCPAEDQSGNGFTGTCYGNPTTGVSGQFGDAWSLDGQDDYINASDDDRLDNFSEFTISIWFKTSGSTGNTDTIVQKRTNFEGVYSLRQMSDGTIRFFMYEGDGSGVVASSEIITSNSYDDGQWHHAVATADLNDGTSELYIDNSSVGSNSHSVSEVTSPEPLYIGRATTDWADPHHFSGDLDEPRIFNKQLNSSEVSSLYANNSLQTTSSQTDPITLDNPFPRNNSSDLPTNLNLSIDYTHSSSNPVNITFYWKNGTEIYSENNVASDTTVTTSDLNLVHDSSYSYYVEASDGENTSTSDTSSFTTEEESTVTKSRYDVLYYTLNRTCPAEDLSGNNLDGTCYGDPTHYIEGKFGAAWELDGQDDYINSSNSSLIDNNDRFSISTWIRTNDSTGDYGDMIFHKRKNFVGTIELRQYSNGTIRFFMYEGDGSSVVASSEIITDNAYDDGNWHHLVATADLVDGEMDLYIDSTNVGSKTHNVSNVESSEPAYWGRATTDFGPSHRYKGDLDEPRIFDKELTSSEIQKLYENNTIGKPDSIQLTDPNPADGATGKSLGLNFSINYTHLYGNSANVSLHWSNGTQFYSETGVTSDSIVESDKVFLERNTQYEWYVNATDGENRTLTDNFSFTTRDYLKELKEWDQPITEARSRNIDTFQMNGNEYLAQTTQDTNEAYVANITDPRNPDLECVMNGGFGVPSRVTEDNYLVSGQDNLLIWDLNNLPNCTLESKISTGWKGDNYVHGGALGDNEDFFYLTDANYWDDTNEDGWLYSFNISNRSNPEKAGEINVQGIRIHDAAVCDGKAFVDGYRSGSVGLFNVSNPYDISEIDRLTSSDLDVGQTSGARASSDCEYFFTMGNPTIKGEETSVFSFNSDWNNFTVADQTVENLRGNYRISIKNNRIVSWSAQGYSFVDVTDGENLEVKQVVDRDQTNIQTASDVRHHPTENYVYGSVTYEDSFKNANVLEIYSLDYQGINSTEDTTAPSLSIDSPVEGESYNSTEVDLNVTSDETIDTWQYNLDSQGNVTFTPNTTLTGLSDGSQTVTVYGNDSSGNTGSDSVTFTVQTDTYVQINSSVQINQSSNNAYINVTDSFNVSNLTVYDDATNFGGINWSIFGDTNNRIDVKLSYFNDNNTDDTYLANYSVSDTVGNVVTSEFVPRPVDSVYQVTKNGSFFKQVQSDASKIMDFGYEIVNEAYTSFTVKRTDQFRPEINSTLYRLDERSSLERMEFVLWTRGTNDLGTSSGPGTRVEFTNTSMKYDVALPIDGTYTVTDNPGLSRNRQVDISKSLGSVVEDSGFTHTLSSQKRKKDLNITVGDVPGIDYIWNSTLGGDFSGTVNRSTTEQLTDTSTGDFLDETVSATTVVNSEVTLGFNYTGLTPLEVNNTVSNQFTGVNTEASINPVQGCTQSNNTDIDVSGGGVSNFDVGLDCDPGDKGNPTQSIVNASGQADERIWYNSTDMTINSNQTENTQIAIKADKTDLKNPDQRDADSLKAYIENISSENNNELNVSDTGSFFRITVGTGFQASSLHTDDSEWSVTYTLSGENTTIIEDGGGGGGTPPSDELVIYFGNQQSIEESVSAVFGARTTRNLTVTNTREAEVTARVEVPDTGFCRYVSVQESLNSDVFGKQGSYLMPAATPSPLTSAPESARDIGVRLDVPNRSVLQDMGISEFTCELDTSSSYGVAEDLNLVVSEGFSLTSLFGSLTDEFCVDVPSASLDSDGVSGNPVCLPVYVWILLGAALLFGVFVVGRRYELW